jgi:hypothetical protein
MTIKSWMKRYYKPERFRNEPGFDSDREERLIASNTEDFEKDGVCSISHFDSVTGQDEYYGKYPEWMPIDAIGIHLTKAHSESGRRIENA